MIYAGWLLVYLILGNLAADLDQRSFPTGEFVNPRTGETVGRTWCRPHPYEKLAWKPWPFRRGRYSDEAREGDVDLCTGEVYGRGGWRAR